MATGTTLVQEFRDICADAGSNAMSDALAVRFLNRAQDDLAASLDMFQIDDALALTQYGPYVTLPTDFLKLLSLRNLSNIPMDLDDTLPLEGNPTVYQGASFGTPLRAFIETTAKAPTQRLLLWPVPDSADPSSQLNGAINSSVTTMTLDAVSSFRAPGVVLIESEKILFQMIATSALTLGRCVRGYAGTTAASHADNTAVAQYGLRIRYVRRLTALDSASLGSTAEWPDLHRNTLLMYAAHVFFQAADEPTKSAFFLNLAGIGESRTRGDLKAPFRGPQSSTRSWSRTTMNRLGWKW